ncbi:MAG TPA: 2Fe-2S iron-sulfur cluster-binding protein, partial [Spirochaetia bacterium]|nr:2Fe-2S iron-sulfur cluster-binding protein [Spirochaetia bacterium]
MAGKRESGSTARVTIVHADAVRTLDAPIGETVLSLLQGSPGLYVDAPCGGNGTCGKCAVRVEGEVSPPDPAEAKRLGSKSAADGLRLACRTRIEGDCRILLAEYSDELQQEG